MDTHEALEAEDIPSNRSAAPTLGDIINIRFGRRDVVRGMLATTAIASIAAGPLSLLTHREARATAGRFAFAEIAHGVDETHHVAPGYDADILIRWGDPVVPGAPPFDPMKQSAAAQAQQFGYNNDFIGFLPLPVGTDNAEHGLLCVNHEYTNEAVMFPGVGRYAKDFTNATKALVNIEMAAHGASIIELRKAGGKWSVVADSRYARRITAETPMRIAGPAAGHARLRTSGDPNGTLALGTINNCAGGMTPWGTYLTAEENFHNYFLGSQGDHPEAQNYKRYGIPGSRYAWGKFHSRFDIGSEPNEVNRFGWIVEIDPLDPASTPVKRTALGRFKHEGAETIVNRDGRVVVYSGDDERFEYVYRFVSDRQVDPANRQANMNLLDSGMLSVARFEPDGTVHWLPLVFGTGCLTPENGFRSQADVLIETRRAADILGATPMDRPEDVEPAPATGKVYVMLTNNSRRKPEQVDAVNDRPNNIWGQIVELTAPGGDHAAPTFRWDMLVKCGDPQNPTTGALWNPETSENGWFAAPDNCALDHAGRLWIATDQGSGWLRASGTADGVWALETEGPGRGTGRMFFRVPVGAEMCGPRFTPDDRTLFVAVQHPGVDGVKDYKPFGRDSTFEDPATRWPDFKPGMPPRPSVVAITRRDGGKIGS